MNGGRQRTLVVIGFGMVAHRLVTSLVERDGGRGWRVVVCGEEPRGAYDRVALSSLFAGRTPEDLSLDETCLADADAGVEVCLGETVTALDPGARTVTTTGGRSLPFDAAVLATGSVPFVPPVPGREARGVFAFRTIADVEAIRAWTTGRPVATRRGVVIGGGLLGLEAADALLQVGIETHVVEIAPRLMPAQVDAGGAEAVRARVEELGVHVHVGTAAAEILTDAAGAVSGVRLGTGSDVAADLVVFSAGIRPRDELARAAGLDVGRRGGVVVDEACATSHPDVYAVGECAEAAGRLWGLVSPGYRMADVVAERLTGGEATFTPPAVAAKLKVLGLDVAGRGDPAASEAAGGKTVVYANPVTQVYRKVVLSPDGTELRGAVLVGDTDGYAMLTQMVAGVTPVPADPGRLVVPGPLAAPETTTAALGDDVAVCSCQGVTAGAVRAAVREKGLTRVPDVKRETGAGTGCGGCVPLVESILAGELAVSGEVDRRLCEHFAQSRSELFDVLLGTGIRTFAALLERHGTGRGCEVCKPAVASILAALDDGHVLDGEWAGLQDTNDHLLANMQKDGSYSVVPRIPGGEITPAKLLALGEVARDFGLYTKVTGAQRIALFGARAGELPEIWGRLAAAGFESGHAYAKAVRTVKSCVGSAWCRYGVGDSVGLAVDLELRYRGLRSPHKIKAAVSGCARECAEANSKDVGVVATESGWNLYVGGNGGMRPRHAVPLATGLDEAGLVRLVDRFVMFYIRTADHMERTSVWLARRPGGVEELRRILVEDALGICADLEAAMAGALAGYECEWKAALADPDRLARFRHFVNAEGDDPAIVFVEERGQIRPASPAEREDPATEVALR